MGQAQCLVSALLALFVGCGTVAPAGDGTGTDAVGDSAADAGKDAKDVSNGKTDVQDDGDAVATDAADVTATNDADAASTDDAAGSDADAQTSACAAEPGAPGCPCPDNSTCDLPICLPTAKGSLCAKPCIDACPEGFKCVGVSGPGGDIQPVCVDKSPHLCDPCVNSTQCGAVGLQGAACVDLGKDGRFCGTACKADTDCPGGYTCTSGTSVEGNTVQQCLPAAGATCTCSASAIADQLSTACFAEAKDGNGAIVGQCKGVRACGPDGLSTCNASIQTETCNGQDDDCDGLVDEGTCDDKNPCTMDTCDGKAQACSHSDSPGSCDADGNNCTVGDACVAGKCVIGALKSCDDGNPCTTDACDPILGCSKTNDDGLPCSDGSACTVGDACKGGACLPGASKTCPDGDSCKSWTCNDANGKCESTATANGTSCSDGTLCTAGDICTAGSCAGKPVDCDDKNPCTLDTCDPIAQCKHDAANTPCDDNNACTTDDVCAAKKCNGTPINVATECGDGNPCTTDTCDKIAGCIYTANTLGCNDGNACTIGDTCASKVCKSGTNTCSCQQDSDCAASEDGNLCNGTLFCDKSGVSNQCKVNPATIITCSTLGDGPCSQTTCDPQSGKCAALNVPDGKSCDADGSVCTSNDACVAGACVPGALKSCNDNNVCTDDACDSVLGCVNTANVSPCDSDGNACTQNDTCSGKICLVGPTKVCDDGVDCTTDSCNHATGFCVFDPAPTTVACDDGNACTLGDKCNAAGQCAGGASASCDDGIACTADFCDPVMGCSHTNAADGTACGATGNWCVSLQCVKKPVCGDTVVDAGEQCDDGAANGTAGDGCSSTCQWNLAQFPVAGELIISEIMFTSNYYAIASFEDEWVELYNNSNKPVLLTGLHFKDSSNNTAAKFPALPSGDDWVLQPGQYALIALGATVGNYQPQWYYGTNFAFNNSGDAACVSGPNDSSCSSDIIAKVTFKSANIAGHSSVLKQSKYASAFATGTTSVSSGSWCDASKPIAGQTKDYGTPGFADPNCP